MESGGLGRGIGVGVGRVGIRGVESRGLVLSLQNSSVLTRFSSLFY